MVQHPGARHRWWRRLVRAGVVVLCAAGANVGLGAMAGGAGSGTGWAGPGRASEPVPATLSARAERGAELSGGRWSTLAPPHRGAMKTWDLSAWTGTDVIAWGSASPCCETGPGTPPGGSSAHGAAFDPARDRWRPIPPAPVAFTVESTVWTGRQVLVWGRVPRAAREGGRNVLAGFDPATWRWERLATPPISPRSDARVLWSGTRLIVIGGNGRSPLPRMDVNGAAYDPRANRWRALPALPRVALRGGSTGEPVGVTAAWAGGALDVWVTRQVSRTCGGGCGSISADVQAVRWHVGSSRWEPGPTPPRGVTAYDATAVPFGRSIALLDGSSCLPSMSCASRGTGLSALLHVRTGRWSPISANLVLASAQTFVRAGHSLIVVSPYLTPGGYVVGGYAAAFDPGSGSWATLPELPVPATPPSGPALVGTVWAGARLIDAGLVLVPGHGSSGGAAPGQGTLPRCPPITFPDWVGGVFCGPAPGPGNGNGPEGSCLGTETAPPCGPRMAAGRYYPYTLISACRNVYVDGRWWRNELPGGSGPMDVWVSVNASGTGAGWIAPNGSVGFEPSGATGCS